MRIVEGIVEKISIKEPRKIEKGNKTFTVANVGIKVGDEWINGSLFERNGEIKPADKNKNEIKEGQKVQFLLEKNGEYENINFLQSVIVESGGQKPKEDTQNKTNPPQKVSSFPVTIWLNCLDSAVRMAKDITVVVKDKDETVTITSKMAIEVADKFFEHAKKIQ